MSSPLVLVWSWALSETSVDSSTAKLINGALWIASSSCASTSWANISVLFVADDAGICLIFSQNFLFPLNYGFCDRTYALFNHLSVSECFFMLTQNPSYFKGTFLSTLLGNKLMCSVDRSSWALRWLIFCALNSDLSGYLSPKVCVLSRSDALYSHI